MHSVFALRPFRGQSAAGLPLPSPTLLSSADSPDVARVVPLPLGTAVAGRTLIGMYVHDVMANKAGGVRAYTGMSCLARGADLGAHAWFDASHG